jgi:hypothetical protein
MWTVIFYRMMSDIHAHRDAGYLPKRIFGHQTFMPTVTPDILLNAYLAIRCAGAGVP